MRQAPLLTQPSTPIRKPLQWSVASLAAILLTACNSGANERPASAGPTWTDYVGAVGSAVRAELRRPSADCQRSERNATWIEAAERMGERDRLARSGEVSNERWRELDAENRSELAALLDTQGWPDPCALTRSAASQLFYVVQHHSDPQVRAEALPLFENMARQGQVRGSEVAMLIDRTLTDQGSPQRFGTQYQCRDGLWVRMETEAPDELEARRTAIGLIPGDMEARLINRERETNRCTAS